MSIRPVALATGALWLGLLAAAAGQPASRTVWDGVYIEAEAKRGSDTYLVFCATCHADDLAGTNSGDSGAPPLRYEGFMKGSTVGALFTKIRRSMPLDAPGTLQEPAVRDVIAYLLQQNGFPAGPAPLPDTLEGLAAIGIRPR